MAELPGRVRVLLLLLWGGHALLAARFFYVCDDALISFRYAQNWAAGHGLRYNLTEAVPVEGFSNFLWVALAALCELVGVEAMFVLPLVSILCAWVVLYRVAHRLAAISPAAAVLGVAFLALSPSFALWSSSGLAAMPTALLVLLSAEALLWSEHRRADVLAGLCVLGVGLIRAEGFVWSAMLVGLALLVPGRRRVALTAGGIAAAGLAAALGARLWWFGQWMPNTVTAKVGFSGAALLRGLRYLGAVQLTLLTPPLALLGAGAAVKRWGLSAGGAVVLLAAAGLAWPVAVGGDFMPMGRLFVTVLPLLALLWGVGLASVQRGLQVAAGGLMIAGTLSAADVHVVPQALRAPLNYRYTMDYRSELAAWVVERDQVVVLTDVGAALAEATPPGSSVVVGALGAVGYYSGRTMIDRFGLITPRVARRQIDPADLTRPGHDKGVDNFFFLDEEPDVLFARIVSGDLAASTRPYAADLLRRELQNRYAPVLHPLSDGRHLFLFQRIRPDQSPVALWSSWRASVEGD